MSEYSSRRAEKVSVVASYFPRPASPASAIALHSGIQNGGAGERMFPIGRFVGLVDENACTKLSNLTGLIQKQQPPSISSHVIVWYVLHCHVLVLPYFTS